MASGYIYVAGIYSKTNENTNIIGDADNRYFNKYLSDTPIHGDGLGFLGSSVKYGSPIFVRNKYGDALAAGYSPGTVPDHSNMVNGYFYQSGIGSRAVVVCGEGL